MKGRLKSLREEIKGTKVKEEHLGSRGKINGAVGAVGECVMFQERKCEEGKKDYEGEMKGTQPRRKIERSTVKIPSGPGES